MTSVSVCVRKRWPCAFELGAQLGEVVDLAVEDGPDRLVFVRQRLIAGGEIDDAQPAMAEADALADVEAVGVGTAMGDDRHHRRQLFRLDAVRGIEVEASDDAAHIRTPARVSLSVEATPRRASSARYRASNAAVIRSNEYRPRTSWLRGLAEARAERLVGHQPADAVGERVADRRAARAVRCDRRR